MTIDVKIKTDKPPAEGDYDDAAFIKATDTLAEAVAAACEVGARVDNLEHAVVTGLEMAGAQ